jgi:outer membrane protein insertion porin family
LRIVAFVAIAVLATLVVGLLVLHTNPVQSRVLDWSVRELERRFNLDLVADDLHYNLAARRVTMINVRLAAGGHSEEPFFTADSVTVKLPWAAFLGRLRFDEVAIDTGGVTITRDEQGVSNLPAGGKPRDPNAPPRRIDIRGLAITRLDFLYRDRQRDIEIRTPQISTDLDWSGEAAEGALAIARELLIRVRDRRVTIQPVAGQMAFDGSAVALESVRLDTSDGDFVMSGDIARALDQPTLDLTFTGTTQLSQSTRWARPPVPVSGLATIDAHMTGRPTAFVLDAKVRVPDATVGRHKGVAIGAQAQLTPNRVTVSQSSIRPDTGGEVQATVDVPFGADAPWWIKANYSGLDAATAFRMADVEPLPFGATLSGNAIIDRDPGEPFRLEVHNTSVARDHPGTAPLDGNVVFIIEGARWSAEQDHRMGATHVSGDIGGVWNRQAATRSTFDGTLAVETGNLGEAVRYASLFGFAMPDIVENTTGPMTATVKMDGTFTEPRFVGSARSEDLTIPSLGTATISADFDASERALHATNVAAAVRSTEIRGEVFADLETRRLEGRFEFDSPNAADLMTALPEALRFQGPLEATTKLAGTVDAPEIAIDVSGSQLTFAGQPVASLVAQTRIVGDGIDIEELVLRQPAGSALRASGRYDWGADTYKVDIDGQDLVWRGALARLGDAEVRFDVNFDGAGPVARPVGEGAIEFAVSGGIAGKLIDRGVANVRLNGEAALVTAHIPALGALLTANLQPRSPFSYEAVLVMNRIDLSPLATLAGLESRHVTGMASLSANASGTLSDIADSDAFVNLQELDARVAEVPVRLVTPSRIAWNGAALSIDNLDVTLGQGRLLASGRLGSSGVNSATWESTFKGQLSDLVALGRLFGVPEQLQAAGPVDVSWQSSGGIDQSRASVNLRGGSLGWGELPAVRELALDATFDGTTLNLTQFTGRWQGGRVEGTASIPRAILEARETGGALLPPGQPGFAKVRVGGLTESALEPWLSRATMAAIKGTLSATLDARITRASLEGVAGTLVLDEASFTIAGVPVNQAQPSILEFDNGVLSARQVTFHAGGGPMTVTGTARLVPTDQQTLNLNVKGSADLRILSAFAPAIATDGNAAVAVGIGGTVAAPVLNGRIDIVDTEVAIREPRVIISDLNGTIALDGQRVVFDAFHGTANGGRLQLDGGFLLDGFTPSQGGLVVAIERAALEYPEGLQSEANAIVTLRPGETGWSLTGEVSVERSAYTEPISIAALLASRGTRAPSADGDEGWIEQLRLNLWVTTLQDLIVDNNYGRFEASAALRVIGTVGEPVLAGRVTLNEGGEVYLAGNTFVVERGSISFTNPFRIVPEFDIQLRTMARGADITLRIEGPVDRLRTDITSNDPTIDSREALSMLFGGLEGEDAITLLSAELLGATGRAIGLDTLRVERGFDRDEFRADPGLVATVTDPATRLTLSKRLRSDVELILSQSLRESGGLTAIVSYKPRRNIEIRTASRDNLDRSVALRHEITFGGGGTTQVERAEGPAITAVTISGEPNAPVEELTALLELDVDDEFNFYQWQNDIDELRAWYHERNHFEVRIRGHRRVSDDGQTVALDYEIQPGPLTEFAVEGHELDAGLLEDLREAWRRTIFDRFLLDEIRTRIARHLFEEDIIGSSVNVEIAVSTPERKQVIIKVAPGTAVSDREIRFRGNGAIEADQLRTVIEQAGLEIDGWFEPARIAETVADYYRSQGYLSVAVEADQPRVLDGVGVLPVQVNEGPRFVVGGVMFPGVSPTRLLEVAAAVQLDTSTPFVTAEIDAARERVERMYARHGFNSVQIEIETEPDVANGTVAVEFAVLEGLQQILREVTTAGDTRTDDDVLRRALRLQIGEPVNLEDWAQARKRLYDTNVFRQVDIEPVPIPPTSEESAAGIEPVRAVVRVVEYPVWRLRYGAEFVDERAQVPDPDGDLRLQSFGVLADLQNQNLFGRAVTGGIAGRYERNRQAASLFSSNSSFFSLPIRTSGFVFMSRQRFQPTEQDTFITERAGLSVEQRWRPFRASEVLWSYRFERNHTFDPETSGELIPFDIVLKVSTLNAAMFLDQRDDPADPSRGWFLSGSWEQAVPLLGSDYGSGKLLVQHSQYRGVGRMVAAGRVQLGTSYGEEALIQSQRFQLGGATTVRGYAENALGPRDIVNFPLGGDALLNFNGEIRFPVRGWVEGVGFLDAGNVFQEPSNLSFADLAYGYGIGLRLATPFAMLRVDFGIPGRTLDGKPAHQWKSGRWYFGVGHIF